MIYFPDINPLDEDNDDGSTIIDIRGLHKYCLMALPDGFAGFNGYKKPI